VFDYRMPEPAGGDVCTYCREPMGWPGPSGVVFADGTAAHHACYERTEVERVRRQAGNALSPDALADEAVLCVRGEPLP
jgi:hypothetical protein